MQDVKIFVHQISMVFDQNKYLNKLFIIFVFILGKPYAKDEQIFLDSTGCNKMIMIVTDGATETALNVFQTRNWSPNNVSTCHPIEVK